MVQFGVFGAGSVGCYLGGCLQAAGHSVRFMGREYRQQEVQAHGLQLSDYKGRSHTLKTVDFVTHINALAEVDVLLFTVKSAQTLASAAMLAPVLKPGCVVLSLQNGIGNAAILKESLPHCIVLAGMVPFNILHQRAGSFHQGTEGYLAFEHSASVRAWLEPIWLSAKLPPTWHDDMNAVLWSKLLLNLNNAINALSDLPLKEELSQWAYRRCLALCQREALGLLRSAGIKPARLTPLDPHWIPRLISLPNFVFRAISGAMLEIDPLARSSMWEDFQAGRTSEVNWINGEVVRLAQKLGRDAPINACMQRLVHEAEAGGRKQWPGSELLLELKKAARAT